MSTGRRCSALLAALVLLVLLLPPARRVLETTMTAQMLLLMPLLVVAGVLLRAALPPRVVRLSAPWDYRGITGLVLASVASAFWLLPHLLDSAVSQPAVDAARYVSIPLLIGLPFSVSWPRMSFIVRGVFLLECIATLFRMGWLYLIWPDRLCNNYLLDDQQRLGQCLVLIGLAACVLVGVKLLWGHFDTLAGAPRASAQH
ncbi:MAG: hypothetical protein ACRETG_00045 [Steroidobacteraceae bacterium]